MRKNYWAAPIWREYPKIMNDKLNVDLDYVENRSFNSDVHILVKTAAILFGYTGR